MFGFLRRSRKGSIEKEFGSLTIDRIVSDIDENSLTPDIIAISLCRFAILGGLHLKKSIDTQKILKDAEPNKIVVECIAFTWSQIYRACLSSRNVDIYEDEDLADVVYSCGEALQAILNEYTDFEIKKNFISLYLKTDLTKSAGVLSVRLLSASNIEILSGDINDHILTPVAVNIYASSMLDGLITASINLLRIYLKYDEFL